MYAPIPPADHGTYRHTPALASAVALAALPFAALFVAAYPTVALALLVGLIAGRTGKP
ncbi:hypothetical protein [Halorarum halobium]|uniref:hypothetical protein n=1 Tax=Halorarum halobium TaxID=3075121 RepID=UPI0028A78228|nr:hypothetical protein [Halobaculum sp. XH14]